MNNQDEKYAGKITVAGEHIKAIVADDNEASRSFMALMMRRLNNDMLVDVFRHGGLALEAMIKAVIPYDIVITDYQMPEMDGVEFISRIRELPDYESVPVVFVSANLDNDLRMRAFVAGATDVISRPLAVDEFSLRCSNLLRIRVNSRATPPAE